MILSDVAALAIPFFDFLEQELNISLLGYNNFDYIKPIHHYRTQTFYTLHLILDGSGSFFVEDKEYKVGQGDLFFTPPGVRFCYYPIEGQSWKYIWFEISGSHVLPYMEKMGFHNNNHVVPCMDFSGISIALQQIFLDHQKKLSVGYYEILSVFFHLLNANDFRQDRKITNIVDDITNYIHHHSLNYSLSIPELCQTFHISQSYLCKLFRDAHQCSPKNYIIQTRISNACKFLETTTLSVKEIAFSAGFIDEVHFMKTFKKYVGKTPTQYRQKRQSP